MDYFSLIFTRVLAHGIVERADRKRRHLGFGFRTTLFLVVLLPVCIGRLVGLLAREGATGLEVVLLLSWGEIDLWVRFLWHN